MLSEFNAAILLQTLFNGQEGNCPASRGEYQTLYAAEMRSKAITPLHHH